MAMLPNPLPTLADDPAGAPLGLRLPPGALLDRTMHGRWPEPLLWVADETAGADAWEALLPARAVGLLPVLIDQERFGVRDFDLAPEDTSYPGDHDAEDVLHGFWTGAAWRDDEDEPEGEDEAAAEHGGDGEDGLADADGRGGWPGLAPACEPAADPDARAAEVAGELVDAALLGEPRIALVRARRSADIPAAIGWCGPLNHDNDVARLCAVLRSWEDRFGIRVIALGFDTLTVSVAAPPRTPEEAAAVAVEHYAFCPDNVDQGCGSLEEYAATEVLGRERWSFWWD